ncbi:MGDG synthase family glycosyltransferase [Cohnella candidum]|uniref:Glycosyltransferase n=1 Tax=Cohnella candidum TaxID=2674991 RepID=A0A3G3JW07_9BACL|nr:glycosyltransferase [Cohnella candidum]AYQ72433.1 hypothetical protein EAV92_07530 [Cohnella candidum]
MNKDATILIIYSTFGDGHLQVANSLKQTFNDMGYERIHLVDLLAEAHPLWNTLSRFAYLKSTVYCPKLYGLSYHMANSRKQNLWLNQWLHAIGKHKISALIEKWKPDAVIHTFPFLTVPQMSLKRESSMPLTFTVLTDYVLHSRWIHPGTYRYFVATEDLKGEMLRYGVSDKQVVVSGIPVRNPFLKEFILETLFEKYKLNPQRKYLLLAAGAHGVLSNIREQVQTILKGTSFDILLVCGNNGKLAAQMKKTYASEQRIHVFGYVKKMEELMSVSACLVTKAGGITLSEAAVKSLPVVVYRPLPGQEKGNADSLSARGALLIANNLNELSANLVRLEDDGFRQEMARAMGQVREYDAAGTIATNIVREIQQHSFACERVNIQQNRQAVQRYR